MRTVFASGGAAAEHENLVHWVVFFRVPNEAGFAVYYGAETNEPIKVYTLGSNATMHYVSWFVELTLCGEEISVRDNIGALSDLGDALPPLTCLLCRERAEGHPSYDAWRSIPWK